jgi:poly-gamma-glutamate system protein
MVQFRAKSNLVLGLVSVLALLAFIATENSKIDAKQEHYNEKLQAARLSMEAANCIKSHRLEEGIFIDDVNDPNETALIGQEYTLITTDRGYIDAKLSSTNPNIAAIIVQYLKDAGVLEGDYVAVALTGSFPALNISVLAALETLKLKPLVISSVGASNYGANDPYFSWLDMETVLNEANVFKTKSIAASIGGGLDIGRGLSPEGRDLILKAIERNKVSLISEDNLVKNIEKRMELYNTHRKNMPIKAYINVGGGIASLGHTVNSELIPSGLTQNMVMQNFPLKGTMVQMGEKGIPLIQLMNINEILRAYDMPQAPIPLPQPGEGGIFIHKKYDLIVVSIATIILVIVVILVFISEQRFHKLGTDVVSVQKPSVTDNDDVHDNL